MPPRTDGVIKGYIGGDDLSVTATVRNIASGLTLAKAWMTVKVAATDLDAAAVFQKVITTISQAGIGQITDAGASGTGTLLFLLTPNDTQVLMTVGKTYVYDLQVKFSDNTIATIEVGTIVFSRGVTDAAS